VLAAQVATLLTERGLGGDDVDLRHRLDAFRRDRSRRAEDARRMAARWVDLVEREESQYARPVASSANGGGDSQRSPLSPGAVLALAYPDRIAKNRGAVGAFLLANGRGANLDLASPLAREPFLAVAELAGTVGQARILLAAPISLAEIEHRFAARIESRDEISFDAETASLRGRRLRRLGALVLTEQPMRVTPNHDTPRLLAEGIARLGLDRLPWSRSLRQWRDRVVFMRRIEGEDWPDLSDTALAASVGDWLAPVLTFKTSLDQVTIDELENALHALVPWNQQHRLDANAPTHFSAPSGSSIPIDYSASEGPKFSVRVQELFGFDRHPSVAGGKVPLVVELLSPANRPVQVTRDLPGFWRGSYAAVKAEMKGRYPKHPWPDDPLTAPATRRAKRSAR
jgi:ATP-dependent helicase HrpB